MPSSHDHSSRLEQSRKFCHFRLHHDFGVENNLPPYLCWGQSSYKTPRGLRNFNLGINSNTSHSYMFNHFLPHHYLASAIITSRVLVHLSTSPCNSSPPSSPFFFSLSHWPTHNPAQTKHSQKHNLPLPFQSNLSSIFAIP